MSVSHLEVNNFALLFWMLGCDQWDALCLHISAAAEMSAAVWGQRRASLLQQDFQLSALRLCGVIYGKAYSVSLSENSNVFFTIDCFVTRHTPYGPVGAKTSLSVMRCIHTFLLSRQVPIPLCALYNVVLLHTFNYEWFNQNTKKEVEKILLTVHNHTNLYHSWFRQSDGFCGNWKNICDLKQ